MSTTSNARVAAVVKSAMRSSCREAADVAGVYKRTATRILSTIAEAAGAAWAHGAVIDDCNARLSLHRTATLDGAMYLATVRDVETAFVVSFACSTTEDAAIAGASANAHTTAPPLVRGDECLSDALRGVRARDEASLLSIVAFRLMAWNIYTVIDGRTPAMRAGVRQMALGAWGLWSELVGEQTSTTAEDVDPIDDSPILIVRPVRHQPLLVPPHPTPLEVRDAAVMGREFGRLRVVEIHYRPAGKYKLAVRWIDSCLCRCACGGTKRVKWRHLSAGETVSCGCAHAETIFGDDAKLIVGVASKQMTIGQAATLANMSPTRFMARLKRGMTPDGIVLARQTVSS